MPMSPRLLRPRQTIHPEAESWRARVVTAGGAVPSRTLSAVNKFCRDIDAAGLRGQFWRLNLFCGGFTGCFIPLYRNSSPTLSAVGFSSDTNAGSTLFGAADFSESGGLNPNGSPGSSPKYIDTGFSLDEVASDGTGHIAVWKSAGSVSTVNGSLIGADGATRFFRMRQNGNTDYIFAVLGVDTAVTTSVAHTAGGLLLHTRRSSIDAETYLNATSIAADTTTRSLGVHATDFTVFNRRSNAGVVSSTEGYWRPLMAYSIGQSMNAAQVSSYYSIMSSFMSATGR